MAIALLSDIHGNLEAFERVLEDVQRMNPRRILYLGDAVSYGPEPDASVRLLADEGIPCVLGNHELALVQCSAKQHFNEPTRRHFAQTEGLLSKEARAFIATWPRLRREEGMLLVHGCPPDSILTYLFELEDEELREILLDMEGSIAFVGHTHELVLAELRGEVLERREIGQGRYRLGSEKALVNVGSVGQPRDGDNRAKYVLYDASAAEIEVRFVAYDIEKTIHKILDLGFPEFYANRLR
jgi:predicted phosphodiesterase